MVVEVRGCWLLMVGYLRKHTVLEVGIDIQHTTSKQNAHFHRGCFGCDLVELKGLSQLIPKYGCSVSVVMIDHGKYKCNREGKTSQPSAF